MIQETIFREFVDFILLNADMTKATGLYNGKAGLSLSLFEISRYLNNEQIEDKAFNLLQESLIIKNKDESFENGLAGIGYTLLYLIENKLLEVDFDEIFGEQYENVIKGFENIEKEPLRLINSLRVIYFLSKVRNIKKDDDRLPVIIKNIFEGLELLLSIQFNDFTDVRYVSNKFAVLNIYENYLKLIDYSGYLFFSNALLADYADLYRKGRMASSLVVGFYLNRLVNKHNIRKYNDIVEDNIKYGAKNIYTDALSLRERIDLTKLIDNNENRDEHVPHLKITCKETTIHNLLKLIDKKYSPIGYGEGLGRLLLFHANKHAEIL